MRLFDYDSWLFVMFRKITDVVVLQILWVLTSLPIVTLGASTTALFSASMQRHGGYEGSLIKAYLNAFRTHFVRATGLWLLAAVFGGLIAVNLFFWNYVADGLFAECMAVFCLALLVPLALLLVYGFAVQAHYSEKVCDTVKHTLYFAYAHPMQSITLGIIWAVVIALNLSIAYMNFFMLSIGFAMVCCLCAKILYQGFTQQTN